MVFNGEKLAVLWTGREEGDANTGLFFRTFDRWLAPLQRTVRLSPPEASVLHTQANGGGNGPDMVWDGTEFVVVWADDRIAGQVQPDIYFARGRADCK